MQAITHPHTGQTIVFVSESHIGKKILEMRMKLPPDSLPPIPHYHPYQHEAFNVVSGQLTVRINNKIYKYKTGERFVVPRNTVHSMWNSGSSETVVCWNVWPCMRTREMLSKGFGLAKLSGIQKLFRQIALLYTFSVEYRIPYFSLFASSLMPKRKK